MMTKTKTKSMQLTVFQYFLKWKEFAFHGTSPLHWPSSKPNFYIDYDPNFYQYYKSGLDSTAPSEITLVKVKDSDVEVQKQKKQFDDHQRMNKAKLKKIKGV